MEIRRRRRGNGRGEEEEEEDVALFETKQAKGRNVFKLFALSVFLGICFILFYRAKYLLEVEEGRRWIWALMFGAELWFSFYWMLTLLARWKPIFRHTFKDRLSLRYEDKLPGVDIFVCTADPTMEPPIIAVNTILSMMAYNYPPEKLSVYLSDDGGSDLTFYALLEASEFSKHWIPFCKKCNIEPRSPAAYFSKKSDPLGTLKNEEFSAIQQLYKEMRDRIESATKLGQISEEIRAKHRGFSQWDSFSSPKDHDSIVQILIDGRDSKAVDIDGNALPTLVYMAREKRPNYNHNFKAGAMNSLIRVSSKISNGQIILNVDCDMYSNNSDSIRDALCFFMDEQKGHEIAFVQFPQNFDNVSKNDIYGASLRIISEVEFHGFDGHGGVLYIGSGCFHRRETLCGMKYNKEYKCKWNEIPRRNVEESVAELEEISRVLTSCAFEENTQWGKEMGLKYGCPVEDVLTGLSIKCRGWKSVYFNPTQKGFLGTAPTTLAQTLVQHKRWAEGDFQILLSKYNPLIYGYGQIKLALQGAYCIYCLWVVNCLATLCYLILPPLCLVRDIPLFPKVSSSWILPFMYVFITTSTYNLCEFLWSGGSLIGWWNDQRIWMYKRTTSYLFGFMDSFFKLLNLSKLSFDITIKVVEDDVLNRYEQEMMEFGNSSPSMFTILATLGLLNLFGLVEGMRRLVLSKEIRVLEVLFGQVVLCGIVVLINLPLYQGMFFRKDKGCMPTFVTFKAICLAILACGIALY